MLRVWLSRFVLAFATGGLSLLPNSRIAAEPDTAPATVAGGLA